MSPHICDVLCFYDRMDAVYKILTGNITKDDAGARYIDFLQSGEIWGTIY